MEPCPEKAARNGVEAADLLDGLEKVGRGGLDPRVFRVMLHRKPTAEEIGESGPGFLMRVEGQEVTTRRHDPQSGYGQEGRVVHRYLVSSFREVGQ